VNTPPPSSQTPPSSTGGVQAPDGYTTDSGQMSSAGRNISTAAEDAKGDVDEIQPAKVQAAEFGTEHQDWHTDYSAAIEAFGTAAGAMCDNLVAFAGQLGEAGKDYGSSDQAATDNVTSAGASV
jgi:hypothetical protein